MSSDNLEVQVATDLTWYDPHTTSPGNYDLAHGTFTLDGADAEFNLGAVLADRTGTFIANNWDGKSLTKKGAGHLILSGDNTYTGLTDIQDGTVTITKLTGTGANEFGRRVSLLGDLVLDIAEDGEYRKTIDGTGQLVKDGGGRVTLAGDNQGFSGGLAIRNGAIIANSSQSLGRGTIQDDALLELRYDGVFANNFMGSGELATYGSLQLAGNHSRHTGITVAHSGSLNLVDGFVSRALFDLRSGTSLTGYGDIGSLIVRNGATLSPGNSIGLITVAENALFETGSLYRVELGPLAGVSDRLTVFGQTTIQPGALLDARVAGLGRIARSGGADFLIIEDNSFADGTLFDFRGNRVAYTLEQQIRPATGTDRAGYYLSVVPTEPDISGLIDLVGTPNAIRAGEGVNTIIAQGRTDELGDLWDALGNLPADRYLVAEAFARLHGEIFAAGQYAAARLQRRFPDQVEQNRARLRAACYGRVAQKTALWGTLTGSWTDYRGRGGYSAGDLDSQGIAFGADRLIDSRLSWGAAIGMDQAKLKLTDIDSKADLDALRVLIYGRYERDSWFAGIRAGYAKTWYDTKRHVNIGDGFTAYNRTAKADYHDNLLTAGLQFGRTFCWGKQEFTPSVGLDYLFLRTPGIQEEGAPWANLVVSRKSYHSLEIPVGFTWKHEFGGPSFTWSPELRAHYIGEAANDEAAAQTQFASVPGVSFEARTGPLGRNRMRLGAGLEGRRGDNLAFSLNYDFETGLRTNTHNISFTVGWEW